MLQTVEAVDGRLQVRCSFFGLGLRGRLFVIGEYHLTQCRVNESGNLLTDCVFAILRRVTDFDVGVSVQLGHRFEKFKPFHLLFRQWNNHGHRFLLPFGYAPHQSKNAVYMIGPSLGAAFFHFQHIPCGDERLLQTRQFADRLVEICQPPRSAFRGFARFLVGVDERGQCPVGVIVDFWVDEFLVPRRHTVQPVRCVAAENDTLPLKFGKGSLTLVGDD